MFYKTIIQFLLLLLTNVICTAQDLNKNFKSFLSADIYFLYPYPPLYFNKFNYGFGGEVSENFSLIKFSTGIFFYTNNSNYYYDQSSPYEKKIVELYYLNIPILFKIKLSKIKKVDNLFLINTGIVFSLPKKYSSVLYFKNGITPQEYFPAKYSNGVGFRLGFQYSKSLTDKLKLNTSLFCDYKIKADFIDLSVLYSHPGSNSIYEGYILFWGFTCGIEFTFQKSKKISARETPLN